MAKVKITHKASGTISSVSPAEAKALKANPRFKDVYSFEELAKEPTEIEKPKSGKNIPAQTPPKTGERIVG